MVILSAELDNIYGFNDFRIDFSYPKKIVNSLIPEEHLPGRPNFRYKKAVILMGSNASGKTSLGKALFRILELIRTDKPSDLLDVRAVNSKPGSFSIDFVLDNSTLYRYKGTIQTNRILLSVEKAEIREKDSYEKACMRLKELTLPEGGNDGLSYRFTYPDVSSKQKSPDMDQEHLLKVLKAVIGTLDPTLVDIRIAKDIKDSFIIRKKDEEIIIQDGKLLKKDSLSTGTVKGVDIALFLAEIMQGNGRLYYCDESFTYIQSDIEKRIFGIMLEHLGDYDQLIFTTHNTDMLDLNLPKHTYAFLRKKPDENGEYRISVAYASDYLKRNTDSIRNAVENDVFSSLPDDSLLDQLDRGELG